MCGIAGFSLNQNDRFINSRRLAQALLLGIEERGKDATGAAWRDAYGKTIIQKKDVTASEYVRQLSIPRKAHSAILHTRMWTQGPPTDPANNHPIVAGRIVGVHNGTVSNDREMFKELGNYERQGEVDSEAIFATINGVGDEVKDLTTALETPEARMALAWYNDSDEHDNTLHLARGDGSPLAVGQTENGSLIFASTEKAVKDAAKVCGLELPYLESIKEGQYLLVRDGRIHEVTKFFPTPQWAYTRYTGRGYTVYSGGGGSTTSTPESAITKDHALKFIDMKYLDYDIPFPDMSPESFKNMYKERNAAIGDWVEENAYDHSTGEAVEDRYLFQIAADLGAFLRPGNWVKTYVGNELCEAQVMRLPKTFPEGDVICRVVVPVYDYAGEKAIDQEVIYLARKPKDLFGEDMSWLPEGEADELEPLGLPA